MANAKIQPFTSLDQSKHHCYTLSTTCTLFKLASEVGPRTNNSFLKSGCGGRGRPIVLSNLQYRGVLLILVIIRQGPTLAVGSGVDCSDIVFSLLSYLISFSCVWETARYD